jgi:RNA polymerase sigma factor (sigma-70 family)
MCDGMENPTDSALMALIRNGDTSQLAVLFERYHLALYRYLLHMTRNTALSEDLTQEVFFRVLKYASTFDPRLSFPVWLYRMARNVYLDWVYKHRREVPRTEELDIQSPELGGEDLFNQKEAVAHLQEALQRLPEDKREVLVLSRFQNLKYEEIASLLKCEIGTVKVRAYRALKELREHFCELRGERLYDV